MDNVLLLLLLSAIIGTLAGCKNQNEANGKNIANKIDKDRAKCDRIQSAGAAGKSSMLTGFVSTPDGISRIKKLDSAPTSAYFIDTRIVGDRCWSYASSKAQQNGITVNLYWRCPVMITSQNPYFRDEEVLELVDDSLCEFDSVPGDPPRIISK